MAEVLLDKIPPQNLEAEQATLGSMMIDEGKTLTYKGLEILKAEDFYRPAHQEIFDSLSSLVERNEPIDLITTQEELRKRGKLDDIGGTEYLMALADSVPTAVNVEYYARIVERKSILRKLIAAGTEIIGLANNEVEDVNEVLASARQSMLNVERRDKGKTVAIGDVVGTVWAKLQDIDQGKRKRGIPFGIGTLDRLSYGIEDEPQLTIIGGRPSNGKTVLLNQIALNAAKAGKRVLYFSLETSMEQLVQRMVFMLSMVSSAQLKSNQWADDEEKADAWSAIAQATNELNEFADLILLRDIRPGNVNELVAQAKQELLKNKIDMVLIDYIQLLTGGRRFSNPNDELEYVCKQIKSICTNEKIPVVVAAQLNRAASKREDKKPTLEDLRGGGNMEAEADKVILVDNPPKTDNANAGEMRDCKLFLAKHKDGPTGLVGCFFLPGCMRFAEYASEFWD